MRQAEWDKYFPIEQNTGDIDLPDFNIADFTGDPYRAAMDSSSYGAAANMNMASTQDLADINFAPTYIPNDYPRQPQNLYNQ